jgi:hypothetical protein
VLARLLLRLGAAVCLVLAARGASAKTVVEVERVAERWVESSVVRRLVALELGDVSVPPPVEAETRSGSPGLYVRILHVDDRLVVELWDRGELQGQRRLSLSGSQPLMARRIALASGELARRLREQRNVETRVHRRRVAREAEKRARPDRVIVYGRPFLTPALQLAWVSGGQALLLGPQMRAGFRLNQGPDLAFAVALLTGRLGEGEPSPKIQWYEAQLSPGYGVALGGRSRLRFGLNVSVASVHVVDAAIVGEPASAAETWGARTAIEARWQHPLTPRTHLSLGIDGGALLRKVWLESDGAERIGLGGFWVGAVAGVGFL